MIIFIKAEKFFVLTKKTFPSLPEPGSFPGSSCNSCLVLEKTDIKNAKKLISFKYQDGTLCLKLPEEMKSEIKAKQDLLRWDSQDPDPPKPYLEKEFLFLSEKQERFFMFYVKNKNNELTRIDKNNEQEFYIANLKLFSDPNLKKSFEQNYIFLQTTTNLGVNTDSLFLQFGIDENKTLNPKKSQNLLKYIITGTGILSGLGIIGAILIKIKSKNVSKI